MPLGFLLLFIAFPLLELALLIKLGQVAGFWRTMAIVVGTAGLGAFVLSTQGLSAVTRLRAAIEAGKPPAGPLAESMLRSLAGVLLLFPGLITDAVGLLLLVPAIRRLVAGRLLARAEMTGKIDIEIVRGGDAGARPSRQRDDSPQKRRASDTTVIEGEFERIEERTIDPHRRDGRNS